MQSGDGPDVKYEANRPAAAISLLSQGALNIKADGTFKLIGSIQRLPCYQWHLLSMLATLK